MRYDVAKADIYSMGASMRELILGGRGGDGQLTPAERECIDGMMAYYPADRWTMEMIRQSAFYTGAQDLIGGGGTGGGGGGDAAVFRFVVAKS
jgi:hypothetical protein